MQIAVPMPSGLHGKYRVEVYKDGNVIFTQMINNGEDVAGGSVFVNVKGKKTETLDIYMVNTDNGKSVKYAAYNVDYDNGKAELNGSTDEDGLLNII